MKQPTTQKAFGMVEILVAIAVFGTAIVSATAFTIKSLRIIKDNELRDQATAIMVRTLEYTKSDAITTNEVGDPGSNTVRYFAVKGDPANPADGALKLEEQIPGSPLDSASCANSNSVYFVNVNATVEANFLLCNQIILTGTIGDNYEVSSRVVYKLGDKYETNELKGFKILE